MTMKSQRKKMSDYIKRESALKAIEDSARPFVKTMANDAYWAYKAVEEIPAEDVVEVVRCKDCKWLYDEMDDYCCRNHRGLVLICENSYCSYGERKTDG